MNSAHVDKAAPQGGFHIRPVKNMKSAHVDYAGKTIRNRSQSIREL